MSYGVDLARDVAPVCPAALYDGRRETDLWAALPCPAFMPREKPPQPAYTAPIGLASNSLLEGLVFGARSGQAMMKDAP